MIFIIFTAEGLLQAKTDILAAKAELWINPSLQKTSELEPFHKASLLIHLLLDEVDGTKEKPVVAALNHVETLSPKGTEIFVEYV